MKFQSIFDVIGPNMIGPSSSHTAGAALIGLMARKLFNEKIVRADFTLYESFARTGRGHGTDRALLGGVMGFATDDLRIRDAFACAAQQDLSYTFTFDTVMRMPHPNTVDILLTGVDNCRMSVRGESLGGGKIMITRIDGIEVEFTGEYPTLMVRHTDTPGVVASITRVLAERRVNLAFMRLFREKRGENACTVVESDDRISPEAVEEIRKNPAVRKTILIEI